jgi:hypothetical protein
MHRRGYEKQLVAAKVGVHESLMILILYSHVAGNSGLPKAGGFFFQILCLSAASLHQNGVDCEAAIPKK